MNRPLNALLALAVSAATLVACGGDDKPSASKPAPAKTAAAGLGALEGDWTVAFAENAPRELRDTEFTVRFLAKGGVDGAAAMAVEADGGLYTTALPVVDGETLTLRDQGCDDSSAGPASIDQSYTFEVTGDELTLAPVAGGPRCDDAYVETLLTAKPLRRA